jgi:hypothetical protein
MQGDTIVSIDRIALKREFNEALTLFLKKKDCVPVDNRLQDIIAKLADKFEASGGLLLVKEDIEDSIWLQRHQEGMKAVTEATEDLYVLSGSYQPEVSILENSSSTVVQSEIVSDPLSGILATGAAVALFVAVVQICFFSGAVLAAYVKSHAFFLFSRK